MIKKFLKLFGIFLVFILLAKFIYSQGWYQINIINSQSIATPAPFQQDIAICNGSINIGNNFAYIDVPVLFNEIDSNGQNVYFINSSGNILYSWYEGQLNYNGVTCDVWWINLPNGIPANSNVIIYLYIGSTSDNYYSQYYPYVGVSPQVISGYDNGQDVFIAYGYFDNTFDGWSGYEYSGSFSPTATTNGIEMLNDNTGEGTYILPPNNGNIPEIPLIVEEAWYYSTGSYVSGANVIALFGNTNSQIQAASIGSTAGGDTPTSSSSTFVQFENWWGTITENEYGYVVSYYSSESGTYLKSAVTNSILSQTSFPSSGGTVYSYLIVNSTYAQTGYYIYSGSQVWAPLTLLDMYTAYNGGSISVSLNYNPYQYGTLEVSAGTDSNYASYQYVEWVIARAYPPNGVMPSISILIPTISVNTSTNFQFNVSIFDSNSEYVNYTVYLNGSVLTTNNISVTAGQTLTIPYTYQYLFNQSDTYNLTVVAYGQTSGITAISTDIFAIQLDQLNVSLQPYYTYNNVNYTNLYNSNLNINYYCMRPNNTLIIYDNITNQTLQFNLSCNYIETPENLFVNLTPYIQNNTLNYINGSLTYGIQSFNLSFIPLWDTVTVNLTIYLPQILVYTAPLGLNYTVIENDVLPNVTCNISFYDNNTLIANNQSVLTNGSITYSEVIPQVPIHNFNWSITCIDPVNVTTSFTYSTGPYYYNEFNMYMEDSGDIPSNVTYSLTLECANNTVQYSNANEENYTLYLWTNDQCNFVQISQQISGITFDEGFNTNLLSNYAFQWPICLINTSLAYYENPLTGSQSYQGTLISIENPQTGCYLTGSYLYLYSSNEYYNPVPMREGALYAIRINNTFLTTVQGSEQQAISIDQLIVQLQNQIISYINVTLTGANVNLTYINGYPELIVQTPYNMSSVYVQLYNNSNFLTSYNLTSINSNIANVIITNPPGFNFTENEYAVITVSYTNGLQQILYYPPYKYYGTINYVISWIVMLALLYEWFSAYQHYWKIIISIFAMVGALIIATFFNVGTTPLLLLSGFLAIYLYDFAIKYFVEQSLGEQPLFKFTSIFFKIILVMMFVSTILASFNIPGMGQTFTNIQTEINVAQNIQSALNTMAANPLSFPVEILLLAGYLIYGMFTSATIISALFSTILGFLAPGLGPLANVLSITINGIIYIAIAIIIITSLWVILFGLGYTKL